MTVVERGLTPQKTVTVTPGGGTGPGLDITQLLGTTAVKYEEEVNKLDKLSFTIVHDALKYANGLEIGDRAQLAGGYRDDDSGSGQPTRPFFDGYIAQFLPKLLDNGRISLGVVAYDVRYRLTRNKPGPLAYPAPKYDGEIYPREFRKGNKGAGGKVVLKASEIVKGILDEHKIPIGEFAIKPDFDPVFDYINCVVQNADETDFQFVSRLLTGEGQSRFTGVAKDERRRINCNAIWFMEVDPATGVAKVHIGDEASMIQQPGFCTFQWQGSGFEKVPEAKYDPTAKDAKIICKTVDLKQDLSLARNKVVRYRKDAQGNAKGPKGRNAAAMASEPVVRGEEFAYTGAFTELKDPSPINAPDPEADFVLGKDLPASSPGASASRLARLSQWNNGREVRYEAADRGIVTKAGDGDLPKTPSPVPPTPVALPPGAPQTRQPEQDPKTTQPLGERIQKFGYQATINCPGNIYFQTRRTYELRCPLDAYADTNWFGYRAVHEWGTLYTMTVDLGK